MFNSIKRQVSLILVIAAFCGMLSACGQSIVIPDIENVDSSTAKTILTNKGLIPKVQYETNASYSSDLVIRTDPAIGSKVSKDAVVTLYVSKGSSSSSSQSGSSNANYSTRTDGQLDLSTGLTLYSNNMKTYGAITITQAASQVLFENDGVKITLKSLENKGNGYYVNFTIANSRSYGSATCYLAGGYVDDYSVTLWKPYGYHFAEAGKRCDAYSNVNYSELSKIGMTNFNQLTCYLFVFVTTGNSTGEYIARVPLTINRSAFS